MHPFLTLPSANPGVFRATQEGLMEKRGAWEKVTPPWKKVTPPWKKVPTASIFFFLPNSSARAHAARRWASGEGAADGWRDKL